MKSQDSSKKSPPKQFSLNEYYETITVAWLLLIDQLDDTAARRGSVRRGVPGPPR